MPWSKAFKKAIDLKELAGGSRKDSNLKFFAELHTLLLNPTDDVLLKALMVYHLFNSNFELNPRPKRRKFTNFCRGSKSQVDSKL